MTQAYLLLGGNLGDRLHYLKSASLLLKSLAGEIVKKSSFYETAPWGFRDNRLFLNQVIVLNTGLDVNELFQVLVDIENRLGRTRNGSGYDARTIDIDILFYDNLVIQTRDIIVPHPRIQERKFVLEPMCEIDPGFVHPVLMKSMEQLLHECNDPLRVNRLEKTEVYLSPKAKSPASPSPGTI